MSIRLVTASGVTKHLAQEVVNRKVDASFGVGPLQLPEELLWRAYRLERFYVIAPKKYRGKTDEELLTREMGLMVRHDSPNLFWVDLLGEAIKESSCQSIDA